MTQLPQPHPNGAPEFHQLESLHFVNLISCIFQSDFGKFCSKSDQKPFYGIIQAYVDAVAFWKHLNEDQIETWIIQKQAFI